MRSLPFYATFFRKTLAKTAAFCDDRFVRDAAGVGLRRKMIKEVKTIMGEKKGNLVATILGLILLVGAVAAGFYFGGKTVFTKSKAIDLSEIKKLEEAKGQWVTGEVEACSVEFYEVNHKVNSIPTGKEHYYLAVMSDDSIYVIRANKGWYEKHFDDRMLPKDASAKKLTGYVRKIESKFTKDIQKAVSVTAAKEKPVYYIDVLAMRYGIFLLILAVIPVLVTIVFFVLKKTGLLDMEMNSTPGKILMALLIIGILVYGGLAIHTLSMM